METCFAGHTHLIDELLALLGYAAALLAVLTLAFEQCFLLLLHLTMQLSNLQ